MTELVDPKRFEDPNLLAPNEEFRINIHAVDQKISYETKGQVYIEAFTQAILTVLLAVYQKAMQNVPAQSPKEKQQYKELLFDLMNQSFSGTLRLFAPEIALRPDLTEDAILQAENDLIEKAYEHAGRSAKRAAKRQVTKILKQHSAK